MLARIGTWKTAKGPECGSATNINGRYQLRPGNSAVLLTACLAQRQQHDRHSVTHSGGIGGFALGWSRGCAYHRASLRIVVTPISWRFGPRNDQPKLQNGN